MRLFERDTTRSLFDACDDEACVMGESMIDFGYEVEQSTWPPEYTPQPHI